MALRVPVRELSIQNGLQEQRLFQLKRTHTEAELVLIVIKQIGSLIKFLNIKKTFNEEQILDTAEIIVADYDDFSLTAIMDCFHKIKTAKAPFDKKFYESIDGRKLLELFNLYRNAQSEFLEEKHQERKANQGNVLKQAFMISPNDFKDGKLKKKKKEVMSEVQKLTNKIRYEASIKRSPFLQQQLLQQKANEGKASSEEIEQLENLIKKKEERDVNPINQLCQEWFAEFDKLEKKGKLPNKILTANDYLIFKQSEIKVENNIITDETMRAWSDEFFQLREKGKLPDGIDTYSKYFEWKNF